MTNIEDIIATLKKRGIEMTKVNDTIWTGTKLGTVQFTIWDKPEGLSFDCYAELKGGIYELGELATIVKYMLEFRNTLIQHGAREINTTERLYPKDRRGKNTRTSGL